jgi:16S rRNA (adenine1518-N6/adenine1519-N6)-dimethyltransferase
MRARKRFGQHFLHDGATIERIVEAIGPTADDPLVEIGPGLGAITLPLLRKVNSLDVVEIDRDAIRELRVKTANSTALRIHEADALRFEFSSLMTAGRRLRIIGNLPYNISTPLLFRLIEQLPCVDDMHFMLQREVVERIVASPGDDAYGRLTVMLAPHVKARALFDIGPQAFTPRPKVTSTFFQLTPLNTPPFVIDDVDDYARVVAAAFSQRRKTLRNALKILLSETEITAAGIDPSLRAEVLSPGDFAALASQLGKRDTTR